jgi:hypothetical protein
LKFGRPSRTVTLTLPRDTLDALQQVDADYARAVVALVERRAASPRTRPVDTLPAGRRQSLIVIDPSEIPLLPGCSFVRIGASSAFIALDPGAGLADLELAVVDRMNDVDITRAQRKALRVLRAALKKWRQDRRIVAHPRAIVVLEEQG